MKLSKVTVLAIILIGVTLLFAILGSYNMTPSVEGFDENTIGCSGEIVPKCHDKVLQFAGYEDDAADDYILKTEVVVPTCPTCPMHHHDTDIKPLYSSGVASGAGDANGDSDKVDDEAYKMQAWEDTHTDEIIYKEESIEEETIKEQTEEKPQPVAAPSTFTPPPPPPPPTQVPQPQQAPQPQVGLAGSNTPMAANPAPVSSPAPANSDTPPCPACERCPEPAFECKKVPNYRSPSMQNYMPVPVLNDFSKF
jgi:hypothetical protein